MYTFHNNVFKRGFANQTFENIYNMFQNVFSEMHFWNKIYFSAFFFFCGDYGAAAVTIVMRWDVVRKKCK